MLPKKNIKAMVWSPDGDRSLDIVARGLVEDTLVQYLFIICLDFVLQTFIADLIRGNCSTLNEAKSRCFPAKPMIERRWPRTFHKYTTPWYIYMKNKVIYVVFCVWVSTENNFHSINWYVISPIYFLLYLFEEFFRI